MSKNKTNLLKKSCRKGGNRRTVDRLVVSVSADGDKTLLWGKGCVGKSMSCGNGDGGKIVVWVKRYAGKTMLYTKGDDGNFVVYGAKKTIRIHTDNPKIVPPSTNPVNWRVK